MDSPGIGICGIKINNFFLKKSHNSLKKKETKIFSVGLTNTKSKLLHYNPKHIKKICVILCIVNCYIKIFRHTL